MVSNPHSIDVPCRHRRLTGDRIMRRSHLIAGSLGTIIMALALPALAQNDCPRTTRDDNVAIARQWHEEVINRRNPAVLETILAETVVHHAAGGYPEEMDAGGVKRMMGDFLAAFSDLNYTFDLWVAEGDLVVERYTATGTHDGPLGSLPATGRKATWTGVNIFRITCGQISEVWSEVDALSRNRQLTE
jgi:predicted ester cyclase